MGDRTVKQFKDALEEMKTVYNFDDEKTYMQTHNIASGAHDFLEISTVDEKTGIRVMMGKGIDSL